MAYIYEHIRTRGYEPLYFEEHFAYLEAGAVKHFGEALKLSREELKEAISKALHKGRFSPTMMNVVELRYYDSGALEVEAKEIIYKKFSLRALHPQAYLCRVSGDILLDNTSAKAALVELNRTTAQASELGVALWADEHGEVLAIDGAPVIAIFEDEIRFSQKGDGVEFEHAFEVVTNMGRNATRGAINLEELREVKELLFIGHEGLSALHCFESYVFMDIAAEKIASKIAEAEAM